MAWSKKTWVQRIVENVGRRLLTPTTDANVFDITRNEGTIIQAGDGFTVSNMNDLENRIDSGFTDASTATGAVDTKVGVLANLTTDIKTSIVNAINWIVPRLKPATVGTKSVVATSIAAGNAFTAPSDGEYQITAGFSAIDGHLIIVHNNGQVFRIIAGATPNYEQAIHIRINSGQVITIFLLNKVATVEVAFFPKY
jgi:hypothetical protein